MLERDQENATTLPKTWVPATAHRLHSELPQWGRFEYKSRTYETVLGLGPI